MKRALLICTILFVLYRPAPSATTCGTSTTACIITKTSFEQFNCTVDFTSAVHSDAFTLDSIVAENQTSKVDATSQLIASSPSPAIISGNRIFFALKGGVPGQTYIVGVRVDDSVTGERFEARLTVPVQ